jgi:hypothetical protein
VLFKELGILIALKTRKGKKGKLFQLKREKARFRANPKLLKVK